MITLWLLSKSGIHCPKTFPDYQVYYSTKHPLCALHTLATTTEPSSYTQAVKFKEWQKAMQDEFSALHANDSWSLCPRPANKNVIRNKWVYKVKQALLRGSRPDWWLRDSNNKMVCLEYKETFSPVIKPATIRVVLAIHFNWPLCLKCLPTWDEEEVYMEQPTGFVDSTSPNYMCKLKNHQRSQASTMYLV